jgi:hypothetical protein
LKLTLPEPKIELYKDGIFVPDTLNRKPMATKLSNLVENIDDPLVIALDGGWGSGKSVFLKCWVGEHLKTHPDQATTLYFDAFEHDYLDDPLIALTGALAERLKKPGRHSVALRKLKTAAFRIAPMVGRIGLAVATAGGTEAANVIGDAFIESSAENVRKSAAAYWKREDGRRAAMEEFRAALTVLTNPDKNGKPQQKLVIVIDELDRCRPDYALQMLEVIKHFFATPGVHFVLGTNMQELANSVRARYGAGIDAERYLHKFVQITLPMKPAKSSPGKPGEASMYFSQIADELNISHLWQKYIKIYVAMFNHHFDFTLRDLQRIATLFNVVPKDLINEEEQFHLLAGLVIIQIMRPDWVKKARLGELSFDQVDQLFKIRVNATNGTQFKAPFWIWRLALDKRALGEPPTDVAKLLSQPFTAGGFRDAIPNIIAQCLDAFELPPD